MMRLSDILKPQNIKIGITATTKAEAIADLISLLESSGEVSDGKKVLESVLDREATRTTGIGNGLAIPHGKSAGIPGVTMAIGRPVEPIDFQSIDGRPVTIICLLVSPPDQAGSHIKALAAISRLMAIDKFRHAMNTAKSPDEILQAIRAQEG